MTKKEMITLLKWYAKLVKLMDKGYTPEQIAKKLNAPIDVVEENVGFVIGVLSSLKSEEVEPC